jgi:2-amino-4-hydroxy-6-hydroxymethyldihydropteridine diphosphokinase
MNKAYLLIGGNMGDREVTLSATMDLIAASCGNIIALSSLYATAAWGRTEQPEFLNQALLLETRLDEVSLLDQLLYIEKKMGRTRHERYGPRIIDIDILFFNDSIIKKPQLNIPHPHMGTRRFVLEPLDEIASNFRHPANGLTVHEMLAECTDPLPVNKLKSIVHNKP